MTTPISASTPAGQEPVANPDAGFGGPLPVADHADAVVLLLERQRGLYEQLRELGEKQRQLIQDQLPEPLLVVLSQRQQLVDELAQINHELEPYRSNWRRFYGALSGPDQKRVGGLVQEVETLLASIIEKDNHDQTQLEQAKRLVGDELGLAVRAGAAVHAYKTQFAAGRGRQLTDRKG